MTRGRYSSCEHDAPGITFRYPGRENIRDAKPTPAETFRGRARASTVFLKALLRAAGAVAAPVLSLVFAGLAGLSLRVFEAGAVVISPRGAVVIPLGRPIHRR